MLIYQARYAIRVEQAGTLNHPVFDRSIPCLVLCDSRGDHSTRRSAHDLYAYRQVAGHWLKR